MKREAAEVEVEEKQGESTLKDAEKKAGVAREVAAAAQGCTKDDVKLEQGIRRGFTAAPGNREHTTSTDVECCLKCTLQEECTAWVRRPSDGTCFLSKQGGDIVFKDKPDRNSGLRGVSKEEKEIERDSKEKSEKEQLLQARQEGFAKKEVAFKNQQQNALAARDEAEAKALQQKEQLEEEREKVDQKAADETGTKELKVKATKEDEELRTKDASKTCKERENDAKLAEQGVEETQKEAEKSMKAATERATKV